MEPLKGIAAKERPRIALVSHDFYPPDGGQGRNFYELFTHLQQLDRKHEYFALSPCKNSVPNHIRLSGWSKTLPVDQIFFSLGVNLELASAVRKHQIDCVLFSGGPGGVLSFTEIPCPFVFCVNHTYHQQINYIENQKWKKVFLPLERATYRRARCLVTISTTTRDTLIDHYGFTADEITVIPVGIDPTKFAPLTSPRDPDLVFFVGRLEPRKGLPFLLGAFQVLAEANQKARLVISGTGWLEKELKSQAKASAHGARIEFLGRVEDQELLEWYQRAAIVVIPSVFEGLGICVLEALAAGAPVVATEVPGIVDIISNRENGLLVPYGDQSQLAVTLDTLLTDQSLRSRLSQAGPESVAARFSWEAVCQKYSTLFDNLISQTAGDDNARSTS